MIGAVLLAASVEASVAILYKQTSSGGMEMACTATAFIDPATKKRAFLTAAHCVTVEIKDKFVLTEDPLFLSDDKLDHKDYVRANYVRVGREETGYDYAILQSDLDLAPLELGDEKLESAHVKFTNVAAPVGIGKATFDGSVALRFIDRPIRDEDQGIQWSGSMLVDVASDGGSSGSSMVSKDTGKIIGIIVGHYHSLKIAVPASRITNTTSEYLLFPNASGSPKVK